VADGKHNVELIAQDAAQNTSVIYTATVTIANVQKTTTLGALTGPGTTNTTQDTPPAGPNSPNGVPATAAAQLRLGWRGPVKHTFTHSAFALPGRLLTSQGQPIAGAILNVLERTDGTTNTRLIAQTDTRSDGTFNVQVPAGASRTIEVGYRASFTTASYSTAIRLHETVTAGVQLHITLPVKGLIIITGKVLGQIPKKGTIVELLVHYHGSWEPFRKARTNKQGRFRTKYQFQGAVGRFPFQAEVPEGQADFPFATGYSQTVDVQTD
jgi:5-hydroxyisourate hydrolase-like protein (transthyretin family)